MLNLLYHRLSSNIYKLNLWMIIVIYFTVAIFYHTQLSDSIFSQWFYHMYECTMVIAISYYILVLLHKIYKYLISINVDVSKIPISITEIKVSVLTLSYYKFIKAIMLTSGYIVCDGDINRLYKFDLDVLPSLLIALVLMSLTILLKYIVNRCKSKVG